MKNEKKMIEQLKKQIRDLRKVNMNLKQQLKTSEYDRKIIQTEDLTSNLENEAFKERLITILESTSDFISTSTPDFKITYINKAGMRMIGINSGVLPKNLKVLDCHPQWALEIIQNEGIPKAISEGIWRGETALLKIDGTEIPISQVIMSHKSNNGEVGYLSTIIRDISELKDFEKKLVEGENQYRMLIENIPDVTWKSTSDGGTTFISPNIKDILGYTQKEIIGGEVDWFDLIPEEDREMVEKSFEKIFTENKEYNIKYRIFSKDGTLKWIHDRALSSVSKEGENLIVYGILSDITLQKKAEELLIESEEKWKSITKNSPDYIMTLDLNKKIQFSNKILPELTMDQVIGNSVFNLIPENFWKTTKKCFDRVQKTHKNDIYYTDFNSPEKGLLKFEARVGPILKKGKIIGYTVSSTDITERIKAEEELEYYLEFEKLVSGISAEFINIPITKINNSINNALKKLVQFTNTTRGNVFLFSKDLSESSCTHEFCINPKESQIKNTQRIPSKTFSFLEKKYKNFESYMLSSPNDIPDEAIGLKKLYARTGFHPFINVPMVSKEKLYGVLQINGRLNEIKQWPDKFESLLKFIGNIFVNALERKTTEEKLRESEGKFRLISEQSLLGILIIQDDIIKYTNEAVSNIIGYTEEQIITGHPMEYSTILHTEDWKFAMEQSRMKQHDEKGAIANYKLRILPVTATGKIKWIEIYSHTISYLGKPAELLTMIDITEKMRTEVALRESEEKFRMISEQSLLGILIVQDENIIYRNDTVFKIFEYTDEEMMSWKPREYLKFLHPDDLKFVMEQSRIKQHDEEGAIINYKLRAFTKTGKIIWIEIFSHTISYLGKPADLVTMIDITEKIRTETALKESEEKFKSERNKAQKYFDIAGSILIALDKEGKIALINKKGCEILEYSEKEILGRDWFDEFLPNHNKEEVKGVFKGLMRGETEFTEYHENIIISKNGTERLMAWYNTLIKDEDGNINGILSSGEDITERKRAEKELIESEEKFRGLFDNITVGFAYHKIILNNDGIPVDYEYIDINSMFTQLTGIIREKAIGKRVTEIFPGIENDPADWIGKYGKVALERLHLSFENYSEPLKKWYLVNAYSPKKGYFVTIFIDISERKKTDEKLRESEEKFRMLSEQSLMAVLIIQDDVAKYANEAYSKIIEYPIDEILTWEANKIFQTVHPEDRKLVKEQARKKQIGIENGVITHYTYRIISRTGKVKWVENYSKTLQYGDKSADFITLIDITETIIAERAKQESENRYQNLVETMNEGLAIIDINNKITYVNPKLIRMVGFSREDLIDKTIFDFFGEKDKMIISNQLSKHKKDFPGIFEMEWHKKDGSTLYTMISTQQILDEQGNNSGSSAVITDITDLKKNEQELENRTESLEKALKEKESLMRELHHRVKNNLQIISAITVLHEATVDEKTAVIFKEYQNRIKAMAKIHETLYRSEDIENIDMEGYVLNLIQNLILSYNVDPEKIKIIPKIDNFDLNISKAMHYGLIINELISNALKHAFPKNGKGRISVSILKGEGDLITLIVEDDGIGLPSEIDFTNPSTMGLKIIKTSTNQLKGKIYLTKDNGTKWEIIFKEG